MHLGTGQRLPHNHPLYCWSHESHQFSGNRVQSGPGHACRFHLPEAERPPPWFSPPGCQGSLLSQGGFVCSVGGEPGRLPAVSPPAAFLSPFLQLSFQFGGVGGGWGGQAAPEPRCLRLSGGPSLAGAVTSPLFKTSLTTPPPTPSLLAQLWERSASEPGLGPTPSGQPACTPEVFKPTPWTPPQAINCRRETQL